LGKRRRIGGKRKEERIPRVAEIAAETLRCAELDTKKRTLSN
jgi:hypothetical protein